MDAVGGTAGDAEERGAGLDGMAIDVAKGQERFFAGGWKGGDHGDNGAAAGFPILQVTERRGRGADVLIHFAGGCFIFY